jgi:hypothetical protein
VKSIVQNVERWTRQDKVCGTLKEEISPFITPESLNSNGEGNITFSYHNSYFTAHILNNKVYKFEVSAPRAE